MATVNGVNYAATHAPSDGNWKLVPVSEVGGQIRVLYDSYTTATSAGKYLNIGRLTKDVRVWDVQFSTSIAFAGSGATVDIGFAYDDSNITDDPDLFIAAATVNAALTNKGMLGGLGLGVTVSGVSATIPQVPVTITGDGIVQFFFKAGTVADDCVVKVKVLYTID
jgi:hypothetical protein